MNSVGVISSLLSIFPNLNVGQGSLGDVIDGFRSEECLMTGHYHVLQREQLSQGFVFNLLVFYGLVLQIG